MNDESIQPLTPNLLARERKNHGDVENAEHSRRGNGAVPLNRDFLHCYLSLLDLSERWAFSFSRLVMTCQNVNVRQKIRSCSQWLQRMDGSRNYTGLCVESMGFWPTEK